MVVLVIGAVLGFAAVGGALAYTRRGAPSSGSLIDDIADSFAGDDGEADALAAEQEARAAAANAPQDIRDVMRRAAEVIAFLRDQHLAVCRTLGSKRKRRKCRRHTFNDSERAFRRLSRLNVRDARRSVGGGLAAFLADSGVMTLLASIAGGDAAAVDSAIQARS